MSATTKPKMPGKVEIRATILDELIEAQAEGLASIDLVARDIHTKVGGYEVGRKSDHRNWTISNEMELLIRPGDQILPGSPPSGRGANYAVRYHFPRDDMEALEKERFGGAANQHAAAKQALPIISAAAMERRWMRYSELTVPLGRPSNHARAIAQVCNLLDSAAALAGRPLMALWTVRDRNLSINSQAFKANTLPGLRELLLEEAATHRFTADDERAIGEALDQLRGIGSVAAWNRMQVLRPQQEMVDRLLAREPSSGAGDSINDLMDPGSDAPGLVPTSGRRYVRDPQVRLAVLERAVSHCEFCGVQGFLKPDGTHYLECHHIIALSAEGQDRRTNVIALCAEDHRRAHFAADRASLERRMIQIVWGKEGVG